MTRRLSNKDLTSGTVWKRLLLFFLPIAAGTCIQQLYNAVDGLIVGRFVGTVALAAVGGSSSQVINVLIGFFVAVTAGASVVIAQIYGAGRTEDVRIAAGNAIAVFALLGFLLMALGLVASPAMLRLMQTPEDTLSASVLYLRIYFLGVPFILVLNMESNMLRSVGDSFSPFLFMVVCCISSEADHDSIFSFPQELLYAEPVRAVEADVDKTAVAPALCHLLPRHRELFGTVFALKTAQNVVVSLLRYAKASCQVLPAVLSVFSGVFRLFCGTGLKDQQPRLAGIQRKLCLQDPAGLFSCCI